MFGPVFLAQTNPIPTEESFEELTRLTAADWLVAGAIIVGAILLGIIVRMLTVRSLTGRAGHLISRLVGRIMLALIVAIGVVYALNEVGVSMGPLLGLLGLAGLALALAFQDVLENVIAGVMLSLRRPFRIGEQVKTADYEGTVQDVSLRSVTMDTFDGVRVIIPNATVWDGAIENLTMLGARRTEIALGVAYDTDLDKVQERIIETVAGVGGVKDDPGPLAMVHEFGESSINFAVMFWHDPSAADEWLVRDQVARRLKREMDDAGVVIPFPQLVVHSN